MRRVPGCLALANLTALLWLFALTPADAVAEPRAENAFRPVSNEAAARTATAINRPEPEDKAALGGQRRQNEAARATTTTIELPPKTNLAQAERRTTVKRGKASEKMSPTQSYPPPQAQPTVVGEESGPAYSAPQKRGRSDQRPVTTIALPQKQGQGQSGLQPSAPAAAPVKDSRSSKKARQRQENYRATPAVTPPAAPPARALGDQRRKSGRSQERVPYRSYNPTPTPGQASVAPMTAPAPEPAGSKSKKRREARSAAPVPYQAPAAPMAVPAPEPAGSKSKKRREARSSAPISYQVPAAPMAAPAPEPTGPKSKKRREARVAAPPAAVMPVIPGPAAGLTSEQEMTRAYQAFDLVYSSSLGKTRKELNTLWGFPMQKLGENEREVAYGFRQKGLLNLPDPPATVKASAKKKNSPTYYAANTMDPSLPGQYFSCLVVLWVDNKGRGVVVDGEAVGDCFMVETLSRRPEHFER